MENKNEKQVEQKQVEQKQVEQKQSETITLTRAQLEAIVDERVQKGLTGGVKPLKRVTERIATLRVFKGKPVVWYGNVKQKRNEDGDAVAFMDIKLFDQEKSVTVNYLEFLN